MPKQLTNKQRKLVRGIAEGKTQREAAKKAGMNEQYASDLLKKPEIRATLQEIMEKIGLSDEKIVKTVLAGIDASKTISAVSGKDASANSMDFIDVPDWQSRSKFVDIACKLKGSYAAEKHSVEIVDHAERLQAAKERAKKLKP